MNTIEFSTMLAEWRERNGYTDAEAAAAVGARYGTFLHWLNGHCLPHYFTQVAVLRQIRDGRDPLVDMRMTPAEFADTLKNWRAGHGFTQSEAAVALGCTFGAVQGWERQKGIPQQPALAEIVRRLRMPVDEERVKLASKRQPVIEAEAFATMFREWRRRHRLTQTQAAAALATIGIRAHARTIWCWETARALPQAHKLAVVLDRISPMSDWHPLNRRNRVCEKIIRQKPVIAPEKFGRLLREWRKRLGINQIEAAVELGVGRDQAKISKWEKGRQMPRKPVLLAVLARLKKGA